MFFLFYWRKREEEKKREVLTNPVKMKKIKEMVDLKFWIIYYKKKTLTLYSCVKFAYSAPLGIFQCWFINTNTNAVLLERYY